MDQVTEADYKSAPHLPGNRLQPGLLGLAFERWIDVALIAGDGGAGVECVFGDRELDGGSSGGFEDFADTSFAIGGGGVVAFAGADQFGGEFGIVIGGDFDAQLARRFVVAERLHADTAA